ADLGGKSSSQLVADRLTGARVVKAFNTLPAAALASDPHADGGRRVLFLSGDDVPARQEVAHLIDRLGFVAIDLGDFEMGRRLQQFPGGPLAGINMVQFPGGRGRPADRTESGSRSERLSRTSSP